VSSFLVQNGDVDKKTVRGGTEFSFLLQITTDFSKVFCMFLAAHNSEQNPSLKNLSAPCLFEIVDGGFSEGIAKYGSAKLKLTEEGFTQMMKIDDSKGARYKKVGLKTSSFIYLFIFVADKARKKS